MGMNRTGKILSAILVAALMGNLLVSCQKADEATEKQEVIVFAAASMTETLEKIAELYKEEEPEITLVFNFDSSGTLKTQITEGAECDLFISASVLPMDQLDSAASEERNPEHNDYLQDGSRMELLENKIVLAAANDSDAGIGSFEELGARLAEKTVLLAMGNSDVPAGQYAKKIFTSMGWEENVLADAGCITYGSNVKEVTTQVAQGSADCGIIYATDAYSAGLTAVDEADETMCGKVIYPAAVLKNSEKKEEAFAFLHFLTQDSAAAVFESVGFTPIKQ